jgi:hypothetical protein
MKVYQNSSKFNAHRKKINHNKVKMQFECRKLSTMNGLLCAGVFLLLGFLASANASGKWNSRFLVNSISGLLVIN